MPPLFTGPAVESVGASATMTCRQAVLLAAGAGSRLGRRINSRPKCLVEVAGTPIVDNLCEILESIGVEELVVVTGYLHDVLVNHLRRMHRRLAFRFVDNPDYRTTNNIYSLWLARELIAPPFMLLESDLFVERAVLEPLVEPDRLIVSAYTGQMNGTGVEVSTHGEVTRLVLGAHMEGEDRTRLKKTVNLSSFSRSTWCEHFEPSMREYIEAGELNHFYEAALGRCIQAGAVHVTAVDVTGRKWAEIDTPDDLARAEAMFLS